MTSRLPRILAAIAAILAVAYIVWKRQPPAPVPVPIPTAQSIPAPAARPFPTVEIAIEDGKTIDFSKGSAEVRSNPSDQAAIAAALQEMQEATKNITFEVPAKQAP